MVTPVFCAFLSLLVAAEPAVLDAGERRVFALIVDAPSDVVQHAGALFRRHTDLIPVEIAAESIEGCAGSPVCIAIRARAQLDGQGASFLAVISDVAGRISAVLIDLEQALRCADAGDDEAIAECATEHALVATSLAQAVDGREAVRRHLETLVLEAFRPALEKSGHWEPFGSIEVTVEPDAVMSLDGKALGRVAGSARVEAVRPGNRKLAFERAGAEPREISVEVKRGEMASVSVEIDTSTPVHLSRSITLWGGVAITAVGAAISIWAAAAGSSDVTPESYCFRDCSGDRFPTFGQLTGREGDHTGPPRGGVLALPFGYSVFGAGALFSIGALWFGDERELPWIAWLAGAAVGGLAYGLSAALD